MSEPLFSDLLQTAYGSVDARMHLVTVEIQRLEALARLVRGGVPGCQYTVGDRELGCFGGKLFCKRDIKLPPGPPAAVVGASEIWQVNVASTDAIHSAPLSEIRAFAAMVPAFLEKLKATIDAELADEGVKPCV